MIDIKYANAYKEVLVVLNNLVKEDYDKVPQNYIDFFQSNCNDNYIFEYDSSKSFEEQELLEETKYILFGLFEKFWATEQQKAKINTFKINHYNKLEEQKREKYNPNDIFKDKKIYANNTNVENIINNENNKNLPIKVQKQNVFQKILGFMKNLLHR